MLDQNEESRLDRPSDRELVTRLAAGDDPAMGLLFERHRNFVFRVALGICGNRQEAVDVVQEVFLALLKNARRLDLDENSLSTWLFRVARNQAIDRHRGNRKLMPLSDGPTEVVAPGCPESVLLDAERRRVLQREVARLPQRPREVFVLRIGLGLSVSETAALIGIRSGAVRVALSKAKSLLQAALGRPLKASGGAYETRQ